MKKDEKMTPNESTKSITKDTKSITKEKYTEPLFPLIPENEQENKAKTEVLRWLGKVKTVTQRIEDIKNELVTLQIQNSDDLLNPDISEKEMLTRMKKISELKEGLTLQEDILEKLNNLKTHKITQLKASATQWERDNKFTPAITITRQECRAKIKNNIKTLLFTLNDSVKKYEEIQTEFHKSLHEIGEAPTLSPGLTSMEYHLIDQLQNYCRTLGWLDLFSNNDPQ